MSAKLKKLEKRIEANRDAAWYENNLILLKIRNEKLYKKKYGTFEKYLEDRWGYEKRRGYQLMKSAEFMQIAEKNMTEKVNENGESVHIVLPKNEWQIRPLLDKLEHNGERIKVWCEVVGTGEKITAELVQTKVDEFLASGEEVQNIEYIETNINLGKGNHRAKGTGENEWYTPQEYIDMAIQVMGGIDTDPASSPIANETIKASQFYTLEDDGLNQEWNGKVWLNPPYAQPAIKLFIEKAVAEYSSERVSEMVILTHNYTDTAWFHIAASACNAICFTRGRIAFADPNGNKAAPTQGQAFFYYGKNVEKFSLIFKKIGMVLYVG